MVGAPRVRRSRATGRRCASRSARWRSRGVPRAAARSRTLGFVEITVTARPGRQGPRRDRRARARGAAARGRAAARAAGLEERSRGRREAAARARPRRPPRARRPGARLGRGGFRARLRRRDVRRREGVVDGPLGRGDAGRPRVDPAARVRGRLRAPEAREERPGPRLRPRAGGGRAARVLRDADEVPRVGRRRVAARTLAALAASASSSTGRSSAWTAAAEKGLLSEDGALETGRGAFSVEPFLVSGREAPTAGPSPRRRSRSTTATCRSRRFCGTTRTACRSR